MAKRKRNLSEDDERLDQSADTGQASDSKLGLTAAFAPITDPQIAYDEGDVPLGLTQAFGPVQAEEGEDDDRDWNAEEGKWDGFDWSEPVESYGADDFEDEEPAEEDAAASEMAAAELDEEPAQKGNAGAAAPAPKKAAKGSNGKHGKHGKVVELTPQMQQSRRLRRTLIIVIVVIIVLAVALGIFAIHWIQTSQNQAVQQAQQTTSQQSTITDTTGKDASTKTTKTTSVPDMASVLGLTLDEAVEQIGHGISPATETEVDEDDNPIKTQIVAPLTDEPADSKTGTPTMYFGLDEDGKIIQVGYSTSTASLGFGALSFKDAVDNEHVVETTLAEAGINVANGSAVLPDDKTEYSSYASDGTTLVRERCSFSGDVKVGDEDCTWSSVLSYDYTTANLTGNLSDTVRIIYVYITE